MSEKSEIEKRRIEEMRRVKAQLELRKLIEKYNPTPI